MRIAILLDGPPEGIPYINLKVKLPESELKNAYGFLYTNFDDVLKQKPIEFLTIDPEFVVTYHGTNRRLAERLNDRKLTRVNEVKSDTFVIVSPESGVKFEL